MTLSIDVEDTWAILIGTGVFQDENLHAVPAVKNNLADLRQVLMDKTIMGMPTDQIIILENQESIHHTFIEKIGSLPKQVHTLIIYYTGHGLFDNEDLYLADKKTLLGNPRTGFAFSALWAQTSLKAINILYLLDCCFSARASEEIRDRGKRNIELLTASLSTESAQAPPDQPHTAFTGALLRVLKEGHGEDPTLSVPSLFKALSLELPRQGYPQPFSMYCMKEIHFAYNRAYRSGQINQYWKVPPRNENFTGRIEYLEQLEQAFLERRIVALTSLGGVGKTQLAIEYAHRHRQRYLAVLWVNAENRAVMDMGIEEWGTVLKLKLLPHKMEHPFMESNPTQPTPTEQNLLAVKEWLLNKEPWLLILDNADGEMADAVIPWCRELTGSAQRFILITSQRKTLNTQVRKIELSSFSAEEGKRFVLRAIDKQELTNDEETALHQLGEDLGWLPLALDVVAASIYAYQCNIHDYYHKLYQPEMNEWLNKPSSDHPRSLLATFSLACEAIQKDHPHAMDILRICAFLAVETIPEEIFNFLDPSMFNQAIAVIMRYSLLYRDTHKRLLSMHRIVQKILRHFMDEDTQRAYAEQVVSAVYHALPEKDDWWTFMHFLPCGLQCVEWIDKWKMESKEAGELLNQVGIFLLRDHAKYDQSLLFFEHALAIFEKVLGEEHPKVVSNLNNLASLYSLNEDKYEQALLLYRRALAIQEKVLGEEHPDVADSLHNLASLYYNKGEYDQALLFCKCSLIISEKVLGIEHPRIANSLNTLASLYYKSGKYDQTLPLFGRVLAIREKVLGEEHPEVVSRLDSLAKVYCEKGEYDQALPLYERALAIRERMLGKEHPGVINSLDNLATLYLQKGEYDQALPLYERALAIWKKVSGGEEHSGVADSLNNLANLYSKKGEYDQALPLLERVLAIREKLWGREHPEVAASFNNLALLYFNKGEYDQALSFYERALAIFEKVLGKENINVASSLNGLANLYSKRSDYDQALPIYKRALGIYHKKLTPEHPWRRRCEEDYKNCLKELRIHRRIVRWVLKILKRMMSGFK